MPEYATLDEIRSYGTTMFSEAQASMLKAARNRAPAGSTFLSHSTKDVEYLAGTVRLLQEHGASVYIDKKDEALPPYTNKETADILRSRIKESRRFVLLATKVSKESKWIPWELGISDGYKAPERIAIFPGVDSATDTKWTEREYLGLYNRIVFGGLKGYRDNVWMVWNKDKNTATELRKWLSQ